MTSFELSPLLTSARQLAEAGAWGEVQSLLEPHVEQRPADIDLALLFAEALILRGQDRRALDFFGSLDAELAEGMNRPARRRAANLRGVARYSVGELDGAIADFNTAVELASANDDLLILAKATNNLGTIANVRGQYEEALWNYRLAVPILQRLGQPRRLAEGYHNMAHALRDLGQLEEADEHELRAIEFAQGSGARRVAAMGLVGRAEIACLRGDARFAESTAALAAGEFEQLGDPIHEADAHRVVGVARSTLGDANAALASFERAIGIARAHGHLLNEAEALRDRARLRLKEGQTAGAREDARSAISIFDRLGATSESAELQRLLG